MDTAANGREIAAGDLVIWRMFFAYHEAQSRQARLCWEKSKNQLFLK